MKCQVAGNFIPPLLDAVLLDYQRNVPAAREPEVLSTMATIVNTLAVNIFLLLFILVQLFAISPVTTYIYPIKMYKN